MILIYIILKFARGDWRVRGVYLIIDSYEMIRFTFTNFKSAINNFLKYLVNHVLTEENYDSVNENKNENKNVLPIFNRQLINYKIISAYH